MKHKRGRQYDANDTFSSVFLVATSSVPLSLRVPSQIVSVYCQLRLTVLSALHVLL